MPRLRKLVELYESRPFALVGINCFDDEKTFRDGVKEYGVTWISAFQGQKSAPIAEMYQVEGYPTMLLIDHTGKIRFRGHGMPDDMLDTIVKEAEAAGQ